MGTAGAFKTVEEAQYKICPEHTVFTPETRAESVYHTLYALYQKLYCAFGQPQDARFGDGLPTLIQVARRANAHD
jgi:L-ribulokinase